MKKIVLALSLFLVSLAHAQQLPPTVIYYPNASTRLKLIGKLVMTGAGVVCDTTSNAGFVTCTVSGGGSTGNWTFSGNAADLTGAGALTLGNGTATSVAFTPAAISLAANTVMTGASSATNTVGEKIITNVADGSSSVGLSIDNTASLSSGKTLQLKTGGVEQWYWQGSTQEYQGASYWIKTNNGDGVFASSAAVWISISGTSRYQFNLSALDFNADNTYGLGTLSHRAKGVFNSGALSCGYNTQSGTTYTTTANDCGVWLTDTGSAAVTVTLLAAANYAPNARIELVDGANSAGTHNISVARSGSDTINGGSSTVAVVTSNSATSVCRTDGVSKWVCGINN